MIVLDATKRQMIKFISENFTNPDGTHPTESQLDGFKKAELEEVITNANASEAFNKFTSKG